MKGLPDPSSSSIAAPTHVRCLRHFSRRRSTSSEAQLAFEVDVTSTIWMFPRRQMIRQVTSSMRSTISSILGRMTAFYNTGSSGQDTRMTRSGTMQRILKGHPTGYRNSISDIHGSQGRQRISMIGYSAPVTMN